LKAYSQEQQPFVWPGFQGDWEKYWVKFHFDVSKTTIPAPKVLDFSVKPVGSTLYVRTSIDTEQFSTSASVSPGGSGSLTVKIDPSSIEAKLPLVANSGHVQVDVGGSDTTLHLGDLHLDLNIGGISIPVDIVGNLKDSIVWLFRDELNRSFRDLLTEANKELAKHDVRFPLSGTLQGLQIDLSVEGIGGGGAVATDIELSGEVTVVHGQAHTDVELESLTALPPADCCLSNSMVALVVTPFVIESTASAMFEGGLIKAVYNNSMMPKAIFYWPTNVYFYCTTCPELCNEFPSTNLTLTVTALAAPSVEVVAIDSYATSARLRSNTSVQVQFVVDQGDQPGVEVFVTHCPLILSMTLAMAGNLVNVTSLDELSCVMVLDRSRYPEFTIEFLARQITAILNLVRPIFHELFPNATRPLSLPDLPYGLTIVDPVLATTPTADAVIVRSDMKLS